MKRVILLGSTGSIGTQALQVIAASTGLTVVGLSCDRNVRLLLEQAVSLGVTDVAIADEQAAATVTPSLYPELKILAGAGAAARLVREVEADLVLNAIVGFAGLDSTLATLEAGRGLALANKESLVCAGSLVMKLAERRGIAVLPVDSEHSALFQLIGAAGPGSVLSAVLTASGGPFRGATKSELATVTTAQALAHPTWAMGAKITIDSATLMNKGLEVIEAHYLFNMPYDKIDVIIHPQSIVHSMVEYVDGSVIAQMSVPDMKLPIMYALAYPDRAKGAVQPLDLKKTGKLDFYPVDFKKFPAFSMALSAGRTGGTMPACMNAANEAAVKNFLKGRIKFDKIPYYIGRAMKAHKAVRKPSLKQILKADRWAREKVEKLIYYDIKKLKD
jgi:1-deoxy-D-xylulose-5-phosphate reductoisomerase